MFYDLLNSLNCQIIIDTFSVGYRLDCFIMTKRQKPVDHYDCREYNSSPHLIEYSFSIFKR